MTFPVRQMGESSAIVKWSQGLNAANHAGVF